MARPRLKTLALLLVLAFASVSRAAALAVADDRGRTLVLEQPATRIVSLAPNITEALFQVGAGEQIVGVDEFSDYPAAARDIPRVANYSGVNFERVVALQPDLVIAWHSGNGGDAVARARELGLPVFVLEPRRLEDVPRLFTRLGQLTGHGEQAAASARRFREAVASLASSYGDRAPVRVFYQVWHEPLITLNGEHLISDVIALCGGVNVFADAGPLVPYVSMESVIRANPQVIVASGSSAEAPAWLSMWHRWQGIDAVAQQRVHHIPPDLLQRHSMRILEGARRLCRFIDGARPATP